MRIIFSRDRAAQLDLLLRSLERNARAETTKVLWWASAQEYFDAYATFQTWTGWPEATPPDQFSQRLHALLAHCVDRHVTFFCDDDVVFRPLLASPSYWLQNHAVLAFSWRLSHEKGTWEWTTFPRTDHGYPGSLDGHTFRTDDLAHMLYSGGFGDPNTLEHRLMQACEEVGIRRPLMAAPKEQVLVSVPVNRVSESSGCPHGQRFPQSARRMNRMFLDGMRIDLEALDLSGVKGCHHEVQYVWVPATEIAA